ncbi:MAG: Gfo/Idh/MocA family oxidoreductase [Clostridia bacterium]|nr:Gfo/Idh/MocA family oxidoreductase [Clostridia bacterium]
MEKLRIGVVGAGNISCNAHLPAYQNVPNAAVCAIADLDIERARKAAEKFNIPKYYGSVEEMLAAEDIDAVDVCTWNSGHAPVSVAAANAGKHVICEKPLTVSVEEGLRIKNAVEKSGVKFMLAVPGRFGKANMYVHDMLVRGELGEVYCAKTAYVRRRGTPSGWFTDMKTAGGGPVIDIGVHGIDAAWYLMGCPKPVSVSACTYSYIGDYQTKGVDRWHGTRCPDNKFDTEDSGNGIIRFENGASLLFEASWAINGAPHSDTQIFGSKAGVSLSPLTVYGERNGFLSDDVITVGPEGSKFERELYHFCDCVLNGKDVVYPIDQAVMMQKMLNGIYDSAKSGGEVLL